MHETPLKFCSAGEELAWQSLILGGAGGLLPAQSLLILPNLQDGQAGDGGSAQRAQEAAVPMSKAIWKQGCSQNDPKMIFPLPKVLVQPLPQGTGDGAIPHAHPSSNRLGLNPGLPILLQPQLEYKAQKIPVDPQATDWKLYFNKQKKRALFSRSSAWDESENKIPVPK